MIRRLYPVFLAAALAAGPARAEAPPDLSADIPTQGLDTIVLTAGSGETTVTASGDDHVHVRVILIERQHSFLGVFHWSTDLTAADIQGVVLAQTHDHGGLGLALRYPDDRSFDDRQRWTVEIPARLKFKAVMDKGRLVVRGLTGGVDAELRMGDLELNCPGGGVRGRVSMGRLHVISGTTQPGRVSVKSSFGLAALSFNGKLYAPPPSTFHFIGNSEVQQAGGKDDIDLAVTVGEADLRVGPVGDDKGYKGLFDDDK
jgi:hypothetical protein